MDAYIHAHPLLASFGFIVAGAGVVAVVLVVLDLADRWCRCAACGRKQTHHPAHGESPCECPPEVHP